MASRREQVGCPGPHTGFPFLPDHPLLGRGVGLGGRAQEGWEESALCSFFSNMFLLFPLPLILNPTKRSPWHRRPLQPAAWRSPKVGFPLCCLPAFAVGWGGAWGRGLEGPDSSEPASGCWLVWVVPLGWIEDDGATGHFSAMSLPRMVPKASLSPKPGTLKATFLLLSQRG